MKKKTITICGVAACLLLAGGIFYSNHQNIVFADAAKQESVEGAEEFSAYMPKESGIIDTAQYAQYKEYGLTYNEGKGRFYYDDKLVRIFKDQVNDTGTVIGFSNTDGQIDLVAARDSSNILIGLREATQDEFAAKTKELLENAKSLNSRTAFEEGTPEADDSLSDYETYGVHYEKDSDSWSYSGKTIRAFYDKDVQVYLSGDEIAKDSKLALKVIRDSNGKIEKLEEMSMNEFNKIIK